MQDCLFIGMSSDTFQSVCDGIVQFNSPFYLRGTRGGRIVQLGCRYTTPAQNITYDVESENELAQPISRIRTMLLTSSLMRVTIE